MARSQQDVKGAIAGAVMFAPYFILLIAFGVVPVILAFVTALEPSRGNPDGGFSNYLLVIMDHRFLPAVRNVAVFLLIYIPVMLVVVAAMSMLLDSIKARWAVPLRAVYIIPASISGAVAILVWYFMLEPLYSPFAPALRALGLDSGAEIWSQENLVGIFALMAFFTGAGNWIIVQYGSLQSIGEDILEAARSDGANGLKLALFIKLPLISRYLVYMMILTFAAGLQIFVEPYLISSSVYRGLADNWSINQLAYSFAFDAANLGASAALSLLLLLVCVGFAMIAVFKGNFFEGLPESARERRKRERRRAKVQEAAQ